MKKTKVFLRHNFGSNLDTPIMYGYWSGSQKSADLYYQRKKR